MKNPRTSFEHSQESLAALDELTGDFSLTHAEAIRKGLSLLWRLLKLQRSGGAFYIREKPGGELTSVMIL